MTRSSGKQIQPAGGFLSNKKKIFFEKEDSFFLLLLVLMHCEGQEEIDPQRPVKVRSNLISIVQIRNIFKSDYIFISWGRLSGSLYFL